MLSDLMMADLDGIGLLERTQGRFPDMPVVMVTAGMISVALAAIRNGAYDYLLKPFEREQLINAVGRALENRRLKVENRNYQTNLESFGGSAYQPTAGGPAENFRALLTTSRWRLWGMRSTSKMPRPNGTPSA